MAVTALAGLVFDSFVLAGLLLVAGSKEVLAVRFVLRLVVPLWAACMASICFVILARSAEASPSPQLKRWTESQPVALAFVEISAATLCLNLDVAEY